MNLGGICVLLSAIALAFFTWPHGVVILVLLYLLWRTC